MTHSPALTSARDTLDYFRSLNAPGSKDYETASAALAAIDSELAASADAGSQPYTHEHHFALREAHCVSAGEAFWAARPGTNDAPRSIAFDAGFVRGFDIATELADERAGLSRPAPATGKEPLQVAPVSAQGDERAALEQLRIALDDFDSLEETGPTSGAVIDAALRWRLAKPARAQVAQGDEVDARWQSIETAPKEPCTRILLKWHNGRDDWLCIGAWASSDDSPRLKTAGCPREGWTPDGGTCIPRNQQDCVEWMPLPAARAQQGGQR